MSKLTLKIVVYGLLASLFFSSTFIFNKFIAQDGGHWFWSATLRYIYMLLLLCIGFYIFKGYGYLKSLFIEFYNYFLFWSISGSIGFGVFYALICYVADSSPAWVVATTWQFTIIATLFILFFFGKKISKLTWFFVVIIFIGISLINITYISIDNITTQIFNIFLILIASFAYPIGNQLVWELQNNESLCQIRKDIIRNTFSKVFLLSLGSLPFWLILFIVLDVDKPSVNQYISMLLVAIFSGIMATSLFLYARAKANSSSKIALVDSTQSGEVLFTLIFEIIFLTVLLPSSIGIIGIFFTIIGLVGLSFI
ncbi:multidrug resistance efflux transporter family protein [Arcobacter sp. YIC-80]|uniref:multidrug resistance efflux transporter family protein n=1 Tax=Arcobacter sp. YIC-80 TaxID=3376683 RepID=UPI00384EBC2C